MCWFEEGHSGIIFVALGDEGDSDHQASSPRYQVTSNCMSDPVFAPDGHHVAVSVADSFWWNADPRTSAVGSDYTLRRAACIGVDGTTHDIAITGSVPPADCRARSPVSTLRPTTSFWVSLFSALPRTSRSLSR